MQSIKIILVMGILLLMIGAAAFLAGRMFRRGIGPGSESGRLGNGQVFISIDDIIPALELPTTTPEVTGVFVERKDNTFIVRAISFDAGLGGIAGNAPLDAESGPKVEVIVTGETIVYRETTEFNLPDASENSGIQQTIEESTLDDLNSQTMITVWGRKNGDRVIAEVFLYMNPLLIQKS